jgi:hypothetical protein
VEKEMKDTFNSNFYITAATVIPVLYLALIVQANAVRDLLTRLDRAMQAKTKAQSQGSIISVLIILGFIAASAIWLASTVILILGIGGEVAAILVLYRQSDSDSVRNFVLVSTILLMVITTAGPALTISCAFTRPMRRWTQALIQALQNLLNADHSADRNI